MLEGAAVRMVGLTLVGTVLACGHPSRSGAQSHRLDVGITKNGSVEEVLCFEAKLDCVHAVPFTVVNHGLDMLPATTVSVRFSNYAPVVRNVPTLAVGATTQMSVEVRGTACPQAGCSVSVTADPDNLLPETDETNNRLDLEYVPDTCSCGPAQR
jgi:hypothetical protein